MRIKKAIILITILALALAIVGCNSKTLPESSEPAQCSDDGLANENAYYFDLALEKRFDYLPEIKEGNTPNSSKEFLMYAYVLSLKDGKSDVMSKEYVEKIIKDNFDIENIRHESLERVWNFDGEVYTAAGTSYNSSCIYELKEAKSYQENEKTIFEATLDQYSFYEFDFESLDFTPDINGEYSAPMMYVLEKKGNEIQEGMSTLEAIKDLIIQGDADHFEKRSTIQIKYYLDEITDNPIFIDVQHLTLPV